MDFIFLNFLSRRLQKIRNIDSIIKLLLTPSKELQAKQPGKEASTASLGGSVGFPAFLRSGGGFWSS